MKARWIALALVAVCILAPRAAHADGKVWWGRDYTALAPLSQNEQMAAIVHEDGVERMVIAVSVDLAQQDKALWIFPVPGTLEQVKLDVVDTFPLFEGYDPRPNARQKIRGFGATLTATQIYPAVLRIARYMLAPAHAGRAGGVAVAIRMEKFGIHGETVTADSVDDLAQYLDQQGVGIPRGELAAFEDYVGEDYVLALVWIPSREEFLKEFPDYGETWTWNTARRPSVDIQFPTERPFYPLRPTASYGDTHMQINLFLVGYFDVAKKDSLRHDVGVGYLWHEGYLRGAPPGFPQASQGEHIPYTRVSVWTQAENLTDDLWFARVKLPWMAYCVAIESMLSYEGGPWSWLWPWVICMAGLSYVSAGLASVVVYRSWKRRALVGLWNMLTIVGLAIALFTRPAADNRARDLRALFFLAFALVFLALSSLLEAVLLWPLS